MSNQFKLKHRILSEPLEARLLLSEVAWSSYLGGSDEDFGYDIAVDADGNVWVTGVTSSPGWTVGGFDTSYNGFTDAFVAKINADGTLAWSSYLGGSIGDFGYGISVDADGNVTMKETLDLGLTIDERLADGYYYSKSVRLLKYLLEHPEELEKPLKEEVQYE